MKEKAKPRQGEIAAIKPICSVYITCWEQPGSTAMEVEMVLEGDKSLASYLLYTAQNGLEGDCLQPGEVIPLHQN